MIKKNGSCAFTQLPVLFCNLLIQLHSLWVWSKLVLARLAVLAEENNKDDLSNKWN